MSASPLVSSSFLERVVPHPNIHVLLLFISSPEQRKRGRRSPAGDGSSPWLHFDAPQPMEIGEREREEGENGGLETAGGICKD